MREEIDFDLVELEGLCRLCCTQEELAAYFNVSTETIRRRLNDDPRFRQAYESGRANGKVSLRRIQMGLAEDGNATMAVWLGKQLLGQTDKQEIDQYNHGEKISIEIVNPDAV